MGRELTFEKIRPYITDFIIVFGSFCAMVVLILLLIFKSAWAPANGITTFFFSLLSMLISWRVTHSVSRLSTRVNQVRIAEEVANGILEMEGQILELQSHVNQKRIELDGSGEYDKKYVDSILEMIVYVLNSYRGFIFLPLGSLTGLITEKIYQVQSAPRRKQEVIDQRNEMRNKLIDGIRPGITEDQFETIQRGIQEINNRAENEITRIDKEVKAITKIETRNYYPVCPYCGSVNPVSMRANAGETLYVNCIGCKKYFNAHIDNSLKVFSKKVDMSEPVEYRPDDLETHSDYRIFGILKKKGIYLLKDHVSTLLTKFIEVISKYEYSEEKITPNIIMKELFSSEELSSLGISNTTIRTFCTVLLYGSYFKDASGGVIKIFNREFEPTSDEDTLYKSYIKSVIWRVIDGTYIDLDEEHSQSLAKLVLPFEGEEATGWFYELIDEVKGEYSKN